MGEDLYANINQGKRSGLYRYRDGVAERIAEYRGVGEHGPHGLALGPDGKLYLVHGNMTRPPVGTSPTSPYRNYQEDILLRQEDPRGHAHGVRVPAGTVLRCDLDGQGFEIVAGGMRNSYDIAFAPNGELFAFDSDM